MQGFLALSFDQESTLKRSYAYTGDGLSEDSFTKYIAALVHRRYTHKARAGSSSRGDRNSNHKQASPVTLHAVKFAEDISDLLESWHNTAVSFQHNSTQIQTKTTTKLTMSKKKLKEHECVDYDPNTHAEVYLYYRSVTGLPYTDDQGLKYVQLGRHNETKNDTSILYTM